MYEHRSTVQKHTSSQISLTHPCSLLSHMLTLMYIVHHYYTLLIQWLLKKYSSVSVSLDFILCCKPVVCSQIHASSSVLRSHCRPPLNYEVMNMPHQSLLTMKIMKETYYTLWSDIGWSWPDYCIVAYHQPAVSCHYSKDYCTISLQFITIFSHNFSQNIVHLWTILYSAEI